MNTSYKNKIIEKINSFEPDKVFITSDFYDIAGYETVRKNLNRLVKEGQIKRVLKGFYYKPKYIEIIDEYKSPDVNEVAIAIARKYNWTIAPSGNTALNLLGLSTQVPAKWTYISDGRYIDYSFDGITIKFKRRNNSEISKMSTNTAMVIQAIKTIGKNKITKTEKEYLKNKLTDKQKLQLLNESKATSNWIYQNIREICE